jgi:hypothetical protein
LVGAVALVVAAVSVVAAVVVAGGAVVVVVLLLLPQAAVTRASADSTAVSNSPDDTGERRDAEKGMNLAGSLWAGRGIGRMMAVLSACTGA